jgi:endoglucanase
MALADWIASEEVAEIAGFGTVLVPAPKGFHQSDTYRLNASYVLLPLLIGLGHLMPEGPWQQIAEQVPALVGLSAPHDLATDWAEGKPQTAWKHE